VSQYLEAISREALAEYQQFFRDQARRRNGVYALYRRKKLYYVGLARDLRGRLRQHLKDKHGESWDRFSMYLTVGDDHIRELESLVLRIVRPSGNRQVGRFARAQNLRRDFARRVRQDARDRLDMLLGRERADQTVVATRRKNGSRAVVLSRYVARPMQLRATYKGKRIRARVRRDGLIVFKGKKYASPSLAGAAALKHAVNGWWFWMFERAPGDWVRLRELRR
jgi:hypothetical protein